MHIHLPKPLHGWREFTGEVAVIGLGVLIALAAEQVVEHFHAKAKGRDASENVRAEIAGNLGSLESRKAIEPCINRRIEELQAYIDEVTSGGHPPRPTWVGRPQVWTIGSARWDAATNTGGTSLLSTDDQEDLSAIYESLNEVLVNERDEQRAWAQLRAVTHLTRIDGPQAAVLIEALQTARLTDWRIVVAMGQTNQTAERLGIRPSRNPFVGSTSVCLSMDTPYAEGVRKSGMSDVGEPQ